MPIEPHVLKKLLNDAFPDSDIEVIDTVGDNDHYDVKIASLQFKGMNMVAQHRLVYDALKGYVGGDLHAIALKTQAKE